MARRRRRCPTKAPRPADRSPSPRRRHGSGRAPAAPTDHPGQCGGGENVGRSGHPGAGGASGRDDGARRGARPARRSDRGDRFEPPGHLRGRRGHHRYRRRGRRICLQADPPGPRGAPPHRSQQPSPRACARPGDHLLRYPGHLHRLHRRAGGQQRAAGADPGRPLLERGSLSDPRPRRGRRRPRLLQAPHRARSDDPSRTGAPRLVAPRPRPRGGRRAFCAWPGV